MPIDENAGSGVVSAMQDIIDAVESMEEQAAAHRINSLKDYYALKEKLDKESEGRSAAYAASLVRKQKQLDEEYAKKIAKAKAAGKGTKAFEEELKAKKALLDEEYKQRLIKEKALIKQKLKEEDTARRAKEATDALSFSYGHKGKSFTERAGDLKKAMTAEDGRFDPNVLVKALSNIADQFMKQADKIAGYKGAIDTRLQGSGNSRKLGSYWDKMTDDMVSIAGVSPFVKQESFSANIQKMVSSGIAFNVEQRAFMATIQEKIATTFDANSSTLARLIRIQKEDTTAGRLGMESALTAFLNNMYESTEYLQSVAKSVQGNIEEAMSLMGGANAAAFEYQVQKWAGSMYSVGMSQGAVQGITQALGQIAAGDISGLTGNGYGNLMVMAANKAGISIADILSGGLTDAGTNQLMGALVNYLGDVYGQTGNSQVVRQQFANVYGLKASDLKAAANLKGDVGRIGRNNMNYGDMMNRMWLMANTMGLRTSAGEMIDNSFSNFNYTMAAGIASNPALYAMSKVAGLLDMFGGIALPAFSVMGNMVDLETNVADLMRAGALGGSILSGIGNIITGGGGGTSMAASLLRVGAIGGPKKRTRGIGSFLNAGMLGTSGGLSDSGFVGNASGSDVQDKTTFEAQENGEEVLAQKQEESTEIQLKDVNSTLIQIYELFSNIMRPGGLQVVLNESDNSWMKPYSSYPGLGGNL